VSYWARHIAGFDRGHYWDIVAQNRMFSNRTFNYLYRALNNSTATRQRLFYYKIVDSPYCLDCPTIEDSLYHASWECPGTYNIINEIINEIKPGEGTYIRLSEQEILIGVKVSDSFTHLLSNILALTKRYVFSMRQQRTEASVPDKIAVLIFIQYHLSLEYQILAGTKKSKFQQIFHNFM
jgi:hypothetical protein